MSQALNEFEELWANYRANAKRYSSELLSGSLNNQSMRIKTDKNHKDFKRRVKWWFEDLSYMEKVEIVLASVNHEILYAQIHDLLSEDLALYRIMVQ